MAQRFSRPRLIDADDRQYRAFLAQIMLGKENQRAIRPPSARDLFGGEAEEALRGWLAQRYTLSERRIVEYFEHRGRSATRKYRELDAVVLPDPKRIHVFEIKASRKATSLRRAARQLRDTQTILRMLFAHVQTTILLVDTGIPQTAEEAADQLRARVERYGDAYRGPLDPPPTLAEVLASLPQLHQVDSLDAAPPDPQAVALLRFSVDDIVALVGAEGLHLSWDEDELDEEDEGAVPDEPAPGRYAYSTDAEADEADAESPLAAALRRALRDDGSATS